MDNFNRNYLAAIAISFFGNGMYFVAITWLIYSLTHSIHWVGIIIGLCFIPRILLSYLYQKKIVRISGRKGVVLSDLLRFIVVLVLPLSFWLMGHIHLLTLVIIEILNAALSSIFNVSTVVMLKIHVKPYQLEKINRQKEIALQVSLVLGSVLSGVIIFYLSIYLAIFINSITFLLSALLISTIQNKEISEEDSDILSKPLIHSPFKLDRFYGILISATLLISLPAILFDTTMTELTKKQLGGDASMYAMLEASYAVGAFLTGYLGNYFRSQLSSHIHFLLLALAILSTSMAFISHFYSAILLCIGLGYSGIILKVYYQTVLQIITPTQHIASAQGLIQFIQNLFSFLGFIALGLLALYCSNQTIILSTGCLTILLTVFYLSLEKNYSTRMNLYHNATYGENHETNKTH